MSQPFLIVPWERDFLSSLLDLALEHTDGDIGRADFLFPHSRPKRYLTLLIHRRESIARPVLLPGMHTLSSFFSLASGRILARPAMQAGLLDRVGLLLACTRDSLDRDSPFLGDARRFFPWGVRLAGLFEECFSHLARPGDFAHMEEEVSPFAALLLSRLGRIYERYERELRQREWTTPGFDAAVTAAWLADNPLPDGILPAGTNRVLFLAGFHALTPAETVLFRHLWQEREARLVLHADPALCEEGAHRPAPHWSCRLFAEQARAFGARLLLAAEPTGKAPVLRYVSGFDLHSQLLVLREELADLARPEQAAPPDPHSPAGHDRRGLAPGAHAPGGHDSGDHAQDAGAALPATAEEEEARAMDAMRAMDSPILDHLADTLVALPDSGLLMPVLHHLPRVDVNISMGYPLSRSPLFHLLDTLTGLQENRRGPGYYWRDLVALLRHPYVTMLGAREDGQAGKTLRALLHDLEADLRRRGRKYTRPEELLAWAREARDTARDPDGPDLALLEELLRVALAAFADLERPVDLARALEGLCAFLLEHGRALWRRFPIDAECLHRLRQSVIPELARSVIAAERFSRDILFTILKSLVDAERVPFEAVPLVGLQVMGMLETRLLSFRRVLVLDAVEESLPGSPPGDPLLPEALRVELGLAPLHSREETAAYTFFRLMAGAREVLLLWQEAPDAPGLLDQKKKKSRFVEELLWREEQRLGRLLRQRGRDGPLTVLESSVVPLAGTRRDIAVTPTVRALLDRVLAGPLSASLLDVYMHCPARFYHQRLIGLAPAEEVREGDDPRAVGDLIHRALHDVYAPLRGRRLPGGRELYDMLHAPLMRAFFQAPAYQDLCRTLPADSRAMLAEAVRKRLGDYLLCQDPTVVLALEEELRASFGGPDAAWSLVGTVDRLDVRPTDEDGESEQAPTLRIMDYKTGRVPAIRPGLWKDESLFRRMEEWRPDGRDRGRVQDPLPELAQRLGSVQLPLYLLLHRLERARRAASRTGKPSDLFRHEATDARWIALGQRGEEISLFPVKLAGEERREYLEKRIPEMVFFLLRHMSESTSLAANPGPDCRWCSCEKLCMQGI